MMIIFLPKKNLKTLRFRKFFSRFARQKFLYTCFAWSLMAASQVFGMQLEQEGGRRSGCENVGESRCLSKRRSRPSDPLRAATSCS